MREHMGLYRGKRVYNGEWVEGYLSKRPSAIQIGAYCPWYISVPPLDPDDNGGYYNVDPDTVGECTGLTDKNGKLIFEGDICRVCLNPEICTAVVSYNNEIASFCWLCDERTMLLPIDMRVAKNDVGDAVWVEIIGNIHDNPELMEGAEDHETD